MMVQGWLKVAGRARAAGKMAIWQQETADALVPISRRRLCNHRSFLFPLARRYGSNYTTYRIVQFANNDQMLRAVVSATRPRQRHGTRLPTCATATTPGRVPSKPSKAVRTAVACTYPYLGFPKPMLVVSSGVGLETRKGMPRARWPWLHTSRRAA